MKKTCSTCNALKDVDSFRVVKGKYVRNTCKECEENERRVLSEKTRGYVDSFKSKCELCGYDRCKRALEFHHLDSDEKEYGLGKLRQRKWSDNTKSLIDDEIKKCIVACSNCHREIHEGLVKL